MNSIGGSDVTRGKALKMNTVLADDVTRKIRMRQTLKCQLNTFDDGRFNWKRRCRIYKTKLQRSQLGSLRGSGS